MALSDQWEWSPFHLVIPSWSWYSSDVKAEMFLRSGFNLGLSEVALASPQEGVGRCWSVLVSCDSLSRSCDMLAHATIT